MAIVGSAYVIIRGITDKLQGDIKKGLEGAIPTANAVGQQMGRQLSDGMTRNIRPDTSKLQRDFDKSSRSTGDRAGKNIGQGITRNTRKSLGGIPRLFGGMGGRAGRMFSLGFNRGGGGGSKLFVSMALRIGALLPIFATLLGSIGAIVNGLFAMGAAAANAVYSITALAGAFAAMAQAAIVGMVAFKGIGEAVSAGSKLAEEAAKAASSGMGDAAEDAANRVRDAAEAVADAERNAARAIRDAQRAVRDAKEALAQTYIDTERAMRDAIEGTKDAEEARRDAVEDLEDAQRALNEALEEASDRMRDLQFSAREGMLAEQRAVLELQDALYRLHATEGLPADNRARIEAIMAYQQAQLDLEEIQANNADTAQELANAEAEGAETISDAQEDVKDAQEGVSDATRDANDALEDQIALQKENARAIRDAKEALQLAREALQDAYREGPRMIRDAKEALEEAREAQANVNKELAAGSPAADAFAEAMDKLSPAAQSFVKYLLSIKGELRNLKFAAQEGLFPGLERGLRTLVEGPMFPALERTMFSTGKAIGDAAAQIARDMSSGPFQASFGRVTEFNAKLIGQMGRIFGDLAVVIFRVLDAGRPLTKMFMNWVEGLTSGWRETLNTKKGMDDLEGTLTKSGRTMGQLWRIIKNIAEGFGDLGRVSRKSGKGLLDSFEDATKAFANFTDTKAKRDELRKMFADTADNLRAIGDLIITIGGSFTRMGANPAIARTMKELEPIILNIEELMTDLLERSGTDLTNLVNSVVEAFREISESDALGTFLSVLTTSINILTAAFKTPILGDGLKILLQIGAAMYALSIIRAFPGVSLLVSTIGKTGLAAMIKFNAQMALLIVKQKLIALGTLVMNGAMKALSVGMRLVGAASKLMFGPWGLAILAVVALFVLLYKKVDWFRAAVDWVCRKVVDAFHWIVDGAKYLWNVLFGNSIFPDIVSGFQWFGDIAGTIFTSVAKFFTETIPNAAQTVLDFFRDNWPIILSIIGGPIGLAIALVVTQWDNIKAIFWGAVDWVQNAFATAWGAVKEKLLFPIARAATAIQNFFGEGGKLRGFFSGIKDWVVGKFAAAWSTIKEKLLKPIYDFEMKVLAFFGPGGTLRNFFTGIKEWVSTKWSATWDTIKDKLTKPIWDAVEAIKGWLGQDGPLRSAFKTAVSKIGEIWDGIQKLVSNPVVFIIETIYNEGLRKALNLIPGVNLGEASVPAGIKAMNKAEGGVLPGWTPGRDVHHFVSPTAGRLNLSGGEAIMRPEFTRAVGGEAGIARLNKLARKKKLQAMGIFDFASGGVFRPVKIGSPGAIHPTNAVDIGLPRGNPVVAIAAGRVTSSRDIAGPLPTDRYDGDGPYGSYGRVIEIAHAGFRSLYAHLQDRIAKVGQDVSGGMLIGRSGSTGNSSGPHLHFGVTGDRGPYDFMSGSTAYSGTAAGPSKEEKEQDSWLELIKKFPGEIQGAISNIKSMSEKFGAWGSEFKGGMGEVGKDMIQWVNDKIPNDIHVPGPLPDLPLPDNPIKWPFDQGGVADGQGWMAKDTLRPERVLNPKQTELFERMIQALENGGSGASGGGGDIKLDVHVPQEASARDVVDGIMYEMRRLQRGGRYS